MTLWHFITAQLRANKITGKAFDDGPSRLFPYHFLLAVFAIFLGFSHFTRLVK